MSAPPTQHPKIGVAVGVGVGVTVSVAVGVGVSVGVAVRVGVIVSVGVAVLVGVAVRVGVAVGPVCVAVGVAVGVGAINSSTPNRSANAEVNAALVSKNVDTHFPAAIVRAWLNVQTFVPAAIVQSVVSVDVGVVQLSVVPGTVSVTRSLNARVFTPSGTIRIVAVPLTFVMSIGTGTHWPFASAPAQLFAPQKASPLDERPLPPIVRSHWPPCTPSVEHDHPKFSPVVEAAAPLSSNLAATHCPVVRETVRSASEQLLIADVIVHSVVSDDATSSQLLALPLVIALVIRARRMYEAAPPGTVSTMPKALQLCTPSGTIQ